MTESKIPGTPDLIVTISGYPGSGKSTLAYGIAKFLEQNGISSEINDEDARFEFLTPELNKLRFESLKEKGTFVSIRQVGLNKRLLGGKPGT